MENIDNMAKNSINTFSREALTIPEKKKIRTEIIKGAIALCCLAIGLIFNAIFPGKETVPALFYTIGFLVQGVPIIVTGIKSIFSKELKNSMEILVGTAIIACYCTGDLILSILIPLILNVAHFLEERSIVGGREVIDGLKKMNSSKAVLLDNGEEKEIESTFLKKGQFIVIKPGEGIPIDGKIKKGRTNVDQKSMTGEPEAVLKQEGDIVYAGTLNLDGKIIVEVEKEYVDTSFSKILKLLEDAENISTPEARLIDRFMKYYIPFVIVTAAAVALFTSDLSKAIAILVVSCPCGQMLVSSAPMIAALSVAIKKGILIKNSKFIEVLTDIDAVVFDKTGTITKGNLSITEIIPMQGVSNDEIIKTALTVAKASNHPISKALKSYEKFFPETENYAIKEISGYGLTGISSDGKNKIVFGNAVLMSENNIEIPAEFTDNSAGSVSYVSLNGNLLGALCFNDTKREEAAPCINSMRRLGTEKVVILTGDRKKAAESVCAELDVDELKSELLPLDKLDAIKNIKKNYTVLAVGDGINDALALKEADVGIAMGAMGSDVAIQSSDIALMNNNLENIPFAIALANETKKIIYQNLVLSCIISFTMIVLSALGYVSILAGSILHNLGAFTVLLNSTRILKPELWAEKLNKEEYEVTKGEKEESKNTEQ